VTAETRSDGAHAQLLVRHLRTTLSRVGFDLVQPLQIGWYNGVVDGALRLEDFGSSQNLAIVIGNTRALWPKLLGRLQVDPALRAALHPIEQYTEECIAPPVSALGVPASVRWSHDVGERLVAMQRLAQIAGLAYLSESHLSVHPSYGPWIALRAAVTFDVCADAIAKVELSHPCGSCEAHCSPAFERAVSAGGEPRDAADIRANFPLWLAVRDACPAGRAYRYDDAQILYHYLADREQLLAAAGIPSGPDPIHS